MLETHTIFDNESAPGRAGSCRVTDIKEAVRNQNRVNIYIDEKFFCSLDISQVVDLKIKVGRKLSEEELAGLKKASEFGKFYTQALQFVLLRPRSKQEVRDYLNRKTITRKIRVKNRKTNAFETREKSGYDSSLVSLVFERLEQRGYLDDRRFAEIWIENRNQTKGSSIKKLRLELRQKGIDSQIIDEVLSESKRNDADELRKIIAKKRNKYPDNQKLMQYLMRQGFNYSDISDELSSIDDSSSV